MSAGTPPLSGPPKPQAKALNCPKCGAAIVLRSFGQAVTVVCSSCRSILDAKDPNLAILQQFESKTRDVKPLIPLGTRGKLRGTDYEVIGFQRRSALIDGITYYWHEYVLFNPYKGIRYLSEYNGHWNDISICKTLPTTEFGGAAIANYLGETYKHFQSADANTDFVLGEFPWQVRVGEQAAVTDYVHQPSPVTINVTGIWLAFAAFTVFLLTLMAVFDMRAKKEPVLHETYQYNRADSKGESSFVTDVFELTGHPSTVEVKTFAPVSNHWIYLNYALINQDTGQAWDFGREVSYYSGYDSDGSWTEGKQNDAVVIPSVPPGPYYLRIEPAADPSLPSIPYTVDVTHDVPVFGIYGIAFLALLVPVVIISFRAYTFERSRWSESDHPPMELSSFSTSSGDDE